MNLVVICLVVLLAGCKPAPPPSEAVAVTASVASFGSSGGSPLVTDSMEVTVGSELTSPTDSWGPIQSLRIRVSGSRAANGQQVTVERMVTGEAMASPALIRLPVSYAGITLPATLPVSACVATVRHGRISADVCQTGTPVAVNAPVPPPIAGLSVTGVLRSWP